MQEEILPQSVSVVAYRHQTSESSTNSSNTQQFPFASKDALDFSDACRDAHALRVIVDNFPGLTPPCDFAALIQRARAKVEAEATKKGLQIDALASGLCLKWKDATSQLAAQYLGDQNGKYISPHKSVSVAKAIASKWLAKSESSNSASLRLNEIGNGELFARRNINDLRWCPISEQWKIYKNGCWKPDETGEAEQRAKDVADFIAAEAAREKNDDLRSKLLKHALTLTKRSTRETMLKDAASEPGMAVTPEQFDTDPNLFNCKNGTLDLRTQDFYSHDATQFLTRQSPVSYDAHAKCPIWRACMSRWIPDEPTRQHVQDAAGASLSGIVYDEFFVFLFGDGDNGKSTFLRVLELLMDGYSHKTQAETIMTARDQRAPGAPSPELLALKGARLVTVHEIDNKHKLNATLIKDLTGRDSITARGLFEKRPTTFEPQFTLWMFGNGKPEIKDTSGGMWRRPRLIEFGQPIPQSERDPMLNQKLKAELPGILNWALEGLRRVQEQGLIVPDAVKAATASYRDEQDPLAGFITDRCIAGPQMTASAGELWSSWCDWCRANGEREGTQRTFSSELKRRKFENYKSNGNRRWRGIGLLAGSQGTDGAPIPLKLPIENSYTRALPEEASNTTLATLPEQKETGSYGND